MSGVQAPPLHMRKCCSVSGRYDTYRMITIRDYKDEIMLLEDLIELYKNISNIEVQIDKIRNPPPAVEITDEELAEFEEKMKDLFIFDSDEEESEEESEEETEEQKRQQKLNQIRARTDVIIKNLEKIIVPREHVQFTEFDSEDYNRYPTRYDWYNGKTLIEDEIKYVPKEYRVGFSRYYTISDIKNFFTDQGIEIESHEHMEWKEKEKIMNEYIEIAKQKLSEKEKELEQLQQPLVKQAVPKPQGGGGGGGGGGEVLFKDVEKTKEVETYYSGKGRPRKTDKRDEDGKLIIKKEVSK